MAREDLRSEVTLIVVKPVYLDAQLHRGKRGSISSVALREPEFSLR